VTTAAANPSQAGVFDARHGAQAGWTFLRITPAGSVQIGLLLVAFLGLYYRWFLFQYQHCRNSPADWGHAYFMPLVSLHLMWVNREAISRLRPRAFWPGVVPLAFGIVAYVYFTVGYSNHMFQGWAMLVTLFGLTLLLLGPRYMKFLFIPIAMLVFGITVSEMVMILLTSKLQLVASQGAWVTLNAFGINTDLAGNVLTIWDSAQKPHELNVAEACSGMRMLVAFLAVGTWIAMWACREWWQRVVLVMLAGPVALLINMLRVVFLGVASLWNPQFAAGDAHTFIGTLWLIPGFLLFMALVWALNNLVKDESAEKAARPLVLRRAAPAAGGAGGTTGGSKGPAGTERAP
jgi:exosortase